MIFSKIPLASSWKTHLHNEFSKPYMQQLSTFLEQEEKNGTTILPPKALWFNALNLTPLENVKVVILGQDPYPTIGHAHGLAFSVLAHVNPLPKSLMNINKELLEDLNINNHHNGNLEAWAKQGVLLINAVLTVEAGKTNAHQGKGWEVLTDNIIKIINKECKNVVFILWGNYAQKKEKMIDETQHCIIKTPHPSPLSAYRGFFGSKVFSRTNEYLLHHHKTVIHWQL